MFKVINGKRYNTDSAQKMGEMSDGMTNDLDFVAEDLYRTRTGNYFIHGYGGARSRYSESNGSGGWAGSSKIVPISEEYAREWVEKNLTGEEYEKIFGEVEEDGAVVSAKIPVSLKEKLDAYCSNNSITITAAIVAGLKNILGE